MVKTCVNYLKIRTKYTIFMHIKKKKEIRRDPHSQEGIKTELKLLRYLNAHLKSVVVDKGSFEKKSIYPIYSETLFYINFEL